MVDQIQQQTDQEKRRRLLKLWAALDAIYQNSWIRTHRSIIENIQPTRGQFLISDGNRGDRKDGEIVNNTAGDYARKLSAAIDTGGTSEAREWFTLSPEDPLLAENDGVREYCHAAQSILFALIAKSDFYPANRNVIEDLVGPATGLMLIEEDFVDVFRCAHVPIGQYRIAADARGRVNTVMRRFEFTAAQMAEEFTEDKISLGAQQALKRDTTQIKFQVLHTIEPRTRRQYGKIDAKNKPWASTWLELGLGTPNSSVAWGEVNDPLAPSSLLRESGYDEQPFICARWNALGQDAYGKDSPGWNMLGDTKALQALETGGAMAIARIIDPALNVPEDLKNASLLPSAINQIPNNSKSKIEPTVVIPPAAVTVLQAEKRELEARISRSCYGDVLFLLSNDERIAARTAEEIRGKKEERLLQLGGMFSRYSDEDLKKAISRFFAIAQRRGLLPPPPPELLRSGKIQVDFQNPLVTAQKVIGFTAMKELVSFGIGVAQAKTAGVDKLDGDEAMDTAADMLGVNPNLLKSDDQLAQERQQAAIAAKAQQMGSAMTQAAPAIKDLSNSDPEKLRQLAQMFSPAAAAQATGGGA